MELTGKCKEDFEKRYHLVNMTGDAFDMPSIEKFYELPKSMQYAVYVDFFDSVGKINFDLSITQSQLYNIEEIRTFKCHIGNLYIGEFKTRQEAREQAIKKANEIYNQKEI